jgi:hypothetical protein
MSALPLGRIRSRLMEHATLVMQLELLVIIILAALLIAPYISERTQNASDMSGMSSMGMMQQMYPLDTAHVPIPTLSFTLTPGAPDGWYLHIVTSHFTFTPQNINGAPVADEGHAHLYIDGALTVVLGPYFHIPAAMMPPGKHTITVSLNANDHSVFAYQGNTIQATQTFYAY